MSRFSPKEYSCEMLKFFHASQKHFLLNTKNEYSQFKSPVYKNCTSIIFHVYFSLVLSQSSAIKDSPIFFSLKHVFHLHGIQDTE